MFELFLPPSAESACKSPVKLAARTATDCTSNNVPHASKTKAPGVISSLDRYTDHGLESPTWSWLRRVEDSGLETFKNTLFAPISGFLTTDAQGGPRHRFQAPPANVAIAMQARSERAVLSSMQRQLHAAPDHRFTV